MGVRVGGSRTILRITAWHYQAVDMEICLTLLRVYNHGCEGGVEETSLESLLGITRLLIWRSVLLC